MAFLAEANKVYLDTFGRLQQAKGISQDGMIKFLDDCARKFKMADQDQSGDIDLDELVKAMDAMGRKSTVDEYKTLVRRVDDDNSGTLRYWEFINLCMIERKLLSAPLAEPERRRGKRRTLPTISRGGLKRKGEVKKKKRGHLDLSLKMSRDQGAFKLEAHIREAASLLPMDLNGLADPYIKMKLVTPDKGKAKKSKRKTKIAKRTLAPKYNEKFEWHIPGNAKLEEMAVSVSVWDWDRLSRNEFMGSMTFDLMQIGKQPQGLTGWYMLLDAVQGQKFNFPSKKTGQEGALGMTRYDSDRLSTIRRSRRNSMESRMSMSRPKKKPGASLSSLAEVEEVVEEVADALPEKFNLDSFHFLKVLGRGNFGKVLLAEGKADKELFAIKVLKKVTLIEDDDTLSALSERDILALAEDPPFLTKLRAAFQTSANLYLVMVPAMGGDLLHYLMNYGTISEEAVAFYAGEVLLALFFLHHHLIYYRDLKPDNVLLDTDGHVRLADFGLSRINQQVGELAETFCGTPDFIAPEIILVKPYNEVVDFWSLGVLMFQCLESRSPFAGEADEDIFDSILNETLVLPDTYTDSCADILRGFMTKSPKKRLGAGAGGQQDIEKHAFWREKGITWAKLESRQIKPPHIPTLRHAKDVRHFDGEFTSDRPEITPTDDDLIEDIDQELFQDFSFSRAKARDPRMSFFGFYEEFGVPSSASEA